MDEGNVSGVAVLGHLRFIRERLGPDRYSTFRERLTADERTYLDTLTAVSWVPIALSARILSLAAEVASADPMTFHDDIVSAAMEHNYKTVWRLLMRFTSDDALVARAGIMVHRVYDRGEIAARFIEPGHAEVVVTQWPRIPNRAFFGIRVAVKKVLELSNRRDVRVTATRTADGARYEIFFAA